MIARGLSVMALLGVIALLIVMQLTTPGQCMEQKKSETTKTSETKPQNLPESKAQPTEIQQFCENNAVLMGDARVTWQTARLREIEIQVKKRISDLEAKRKEYADWIKQHEDALKKAQDDVVAIYAHMKPDAAALQIAAMDDSIAAAVLAKLSTRSASSILNEIEPGRAARLTNSMLGPNNSSFDKKKF